MLQKILRHKAYFSIFDKVVAKNLGRQIFMSYLGLRQK